MAKAAGTMKRIPSVPENGCNDPEGLVPEHVPNHIQEELDRLDQLRANIHDQIDTLEERLGYVLRPAPDDEKADGPENMMAMPPQSAYAHRLFNGNNSFLDAFYKLRNLTDRIEQ